MWNAYPESGIDLWDQNVINGEYVIAYEINPWLDHKLQSLLPQVGLQNLMRNGSQLVNHIPGNMAHNFSINSLGHGENSKGDMHQV